VACTDHLSAERDSPTFLAGLRMVRMDLQPVRPRRILRSHPIKGSRVVVRGSAQRSTWSDQVSARAAAGLLCPPPPDWLPKHMEGSAIITRQGPTPLDWLPAYAQNSGPGLIPRHTAGPHGGTRRQLCAAVDHQRAHFEGTLSPCAAAPRTSRHSTPRHATPRHASRATRHAGSGPHAREMRGQGALGAPRT
jgi:hypothetical protein